MRGVHQAEGYGEPLVCEICGDTIVWDAPAYIREITMCEECFPKEFDKEYSLVDKAEFGGYRVLTPEECYEG